MCWWLKEPDFHLHQVRGHPFPVAGWPHLQCAAVKGLEAAGAVAAAAVVLLEIDCLYCPGSVESAAVVAAAVAGVHVTV